MGMTGKDIEAAQARMESARMPFDTLFAEIASLVFPRQADFFGGGLATAGWTRNRTMEAVMHDPYAAQALEDGVAAFEGWVMPRGERWQKLALADEALMRRVPVRAWLEKIEHRLFQLRNDPMSGFATAVHESGMSLFAFGQQSTWIEPRRHPVTGQVIGLGYQSEFIGDVWFECDAQGYPIRIHRRFTLSAEQALREWGSDTPKKVRKAAQDAAQASNRFAFIHVIEPNPRPDPSRIDARGKPWRGCYYSIEDRETFREGGYDSLPRIVSRFNKTPNADYGHSPTMTALPLIRQLQAITIDRTIAAEMDLKPAFLAMDDELDGVALEIKPYGITWGGLDDRGNPVVKPLLESSRPDGARELVMEARAHIDRVFYRDLLQINRELKTHITAVRTMEEVAEKGLLLSPLARQENEWLSRMTMRELALMEEHGWLNDMPGEVAEYFEDSGALDIRYDNTLSHMQEAGKSAAYLNLAQQVGLLAQFDTSVVEDFKREFPMSKVLPELARIAGVPAAMMATDSEKRADDEAKANAAAAEDLLRAVPALATAGKDIAQAAAVAG